MTKSARRPELVGLVAASLVTLVGLWLLWNARAEGLRETDRALASGRVIDVSGLERPDALLPLLEPVVPDVVERGFLADRIAAFMGSPDKPEGRRRTLSGVGSLGTITITERDLPPRRHLPSLRERFAERRDELAAEPGETDIPIPLLTSAQLAALRRTVVVRAPSTFRVTLLWSSVLLLLPFYVAHAWLRARRSTGDPHLLPLVHALCGIGFVMMVSLRDPVRDPMLFVRFAQGVAAGCLVLAAAASFDFERWLVRRLAWLPLAGAVCLSLLLIAFGSGPGTSDAKVNLMGVQPVEAIRVLVMLFLAGHFAHRWTALRNRDRLALLPVAIGMGLVLLFFFLQKDLGPAMVLASVFLGLYIVARGRATAAALGLLALVAGLAGGFLAGYPHTVAQRVQMWWSPWDNTVRGGDQIAHALWALGTGAIRGTGIGLGDPRLIPAGHTDLILSAVGEETGLVGLLAVFALFVALAYRAFRIARRAPGDATFFLAIGLTFGIFAQLLLISAGLLDLMPLTGVTTPFLSYGRSSMLANFFAFGVLLAIGRSAGVGKRREEFARETGWLRIALAAGLLVVVGRMVWVQTAGADHFVSATALTMQADGVRRFEYNPRLLAVAQQIVRGTVTDRHGIPLATSRPADLQAHARELAELGVASAEACPQIGARCYPFGGLTYHLLGDWRSQVNWAARNTSFIEREHDARLRGYDDHALVVEITDLQTGLPSKVIRRDLRELVPLLRHRRDPDDPAVRRILDRPRDVRLALDIRLQRQVAALLKEGVDQAGQREGAAVVLSPEGDLLASVSYPWPVVLPRAARSLGDTTVNDTDIRLLDRARYGLYPPGSSFGLVTAAAALRQDAALGRQRFTCERLPDHRVGKWLPGWPMPVRDDPADHLPHGRVDLQRGLIVSCNAYFAQLGVRLGAPALEETAALFEISLSQPESDETIRSILPFEACGQGQVLATPFKMARVAAALAADGAMPQGRWVIDENNRRTDAPRVVLSPDRVRFLAGAMRRAVVEGTGQSVKNVVPAIAGVSGAAEVQDATAHAWFVGFAPYEAEMASPGATAGRAGSPTRLTPPGGQTTDGAARIAFAVLVEHGEDGGAVAAPIAGGIVTAARTLGIIR
jgi:cell division protein FtsW (lipid II flippase)/cell division protein FtsI/penicillin-binding protein 2